MKHLFWIVCIALFLSILAGIFAHSSHRPTPHFSWEGLSFSNALFGFIGCILIIIVSKALGRYWLHKNEDYYEDNERVGSKNR